MSDERKERCETCRFWERKHGGDDGAEDQPGTCHRFPPVLNHSAVRLGVEEVRKRGSPENNSWLAIEEGHDEPNWVFVKVISHEWCGEWQGKESKQSQPVDINHACLGVAALELPVAVTNALESGLIDSVGKLIRVSADSLREVRNIGAKSVEHIRRALASRGLKLKGD